MLKEKIHIEHFYRNALALALPIAFQNLLTSCATLIDTAMVVGLGNEATAAIGVASRFSFLINLICFGFASGCASLLSQYWGARDIKNIRKSLGVALTFAEAIGLLIAIAIIIFPSYLAGIFTNEPEIQRLAGEYMRIYALGIPIVVFTQIMCFSLRSVEKVNIPLLSAAVSVGVNTFLNYVFIFGHFGMPRLELKGAAIGSVAGFIVQAIIVLLAILFSKNPFKAKIKEYLSYDFSFVKKYFKIAFPVLLNEVLWAVGANAYVMVFARRGYEEYAGYTLYENIQQIFFVFFVGICGACAVMVGKFIGMGEHEKGYETAKRFLIMTPIMGLVLGAVLIIIRNPLLSLFPIETEFAGDVASSCLLFYGFWIPIRMIPYTLVCGIFRSGGDTKTGCIYDLGGLFACGVPAVVLTQLIFKPASFWVLVAVMFIAEDIVKGTLCIKHFLSKKWIIQITEKSEEI